MCSRGDGKGKPGGFAGTGKGAKSGGRAARALDHCKMQYIAKCTTVRLSDTMNSVKKTKKRPSWWRALIAGGPYFIAFRIRNRHSPGEIRGGIPKFSLALMVHKPDSDSRNKPRPWELVLYVRPCPASALHPLQYRVGVPMLMI